MKNNKGSSAKSQIAKIIESPHTDNTSKLPLKKVANAMDFMSDKELKPNKSTGGTRSY